MRNAAMIAASLIFGATTAQAQLLTTIAGSVLIDRAGKEARDSIDHAREAGEALLERANEMGKQRLEQVDGILKNTVGGLIGQTEEATLRILVQAKKDADAVREATVADLKGVIWQAECSGRQLLLSDLKNTLGGLGTLLSTHEIRLSPPIPEAEKRAWYCWLPWTCDDPNVIRIKEPFGDTYIAVREKIEGSIAKENVKETTPAHRIVGSYEYLSAFALKTSCFYPGSSDNWNREYLNYREKARRWRTAANIRIQ